MGETWFQTVDLRDEDRMFLDGMRMVESAVLAYEPISFFDDYVTEAFGKKAAKNASQSDASANDEPTQGQKNQEAETKGRSGIMKIIDSILGAIKKLKEAVNEFIQKRKMSEAERKAYEQFREMVKADPSLANKKVRVRDFKEAQKRYKEFLAECDAEYRKVQEDANHPIEKLLNKGKDFIKNNVKGVFHSVNAVGLVNMAGTNKESARFIYSVLKSDEQAMENMRKEMGDKQFKKFEKDMKSLTKRLSIKRLRMKVTHQYYDDYVSAYVGAYRSLGDMAQGKVSVKDGNQQDIISNLLKNQYTGKTIRTVGSAAKTVSLDVAGAVMGGVTDKAKYLTKRSFHKYPDQHPEPDKRTEKRTKKAFPLLSNIKKPTFQPVGGREHLQPRSERKAASRARKAAKKAGMYS